LKAKREDKEKLARLRETLSQQIQKSNDREEELREENEQLSRRVRELVADLETERQVREELGRLGAGLSTDTTYLRSKLSTNELRLLDLAARMAASERTTADIHEKQRRTREVLLTTSKS
jgi:AraC-like DNA-binding protein